MITHTINIVFIKNTKSDFNNNNCLLTRSKLYIQY